MRIAPIFAVVSLVGIATIGEAAEGEFQITPRIGQGELTVDVFDRIPEDRRQNDTYEFGIGFGFATPIGIVLEIGADSHGRLEWLNEEDDFAVTDQYFALGYQFEFGGGWRVIPKVGRSRWKLESDEGLFEFATDDEDPTLRGYDYFYEATLARRVSRVLALGVSYKHADYDFGRSRTLSFVMQFGF